VSAACTRPPRDTIGLTECIGTMTFALSGCIN